ncbi:NYN domain-containing protein [Sulfitobacter sp. HNIBRBA2951]|uniref:NYN domain-containing protein n=1 Tax=Sulfitobacter aquimarinus TaxID=3158557 RepID=UPI0032E01B46
MDHADRHNRPLLAVLIDADNLSSTHAEPILREITSIGEPALRRVYGDWSSPQLEGWSKKLMALGLVAVQASANTKHKNATDIGLVIDAMDILHTDRFDGFVIVSSDSDFTALANRLREEGKLVISIGEEKTAPALRNVVNRFILIENLDRDTPEGAARARNPKEALGLIKNAMNKIDDTEEWYPLGALGQELRAAHPDFDPRSYGQTKLSQLMQAIPKLEYRAQNNGQVRLKP